MSDKQKRPESERSTKDEQLEKHEHPHTHTPIPAPKFGSAGSGGAEFERLPEQHDGDDEKLTES
jgi:hypothetical protein